MKVFGVIGWKNSGKTTLVERLVAELTARGWRVSTVKHAHHGADLDHEGRDSWRHRQAGAVETAVSTPARWAVLHELRGAQEATLAQMLARLSPCDLALVEGYKCEDHPKIEAHRPETGKPLLAESDSTIRAVASTGAPQAARLLHLDDIPAIADFIEAETGLRRPAPSGAPALPPGVDWIPVETALDRLRDLLRPVTGRETLKLAQAEGRVLAADAHARRANPPAPNSAVDGYGFAHAALGEFPSRLPLIEGRAAAGRPFPSAVPHGSAIRILTGAILPDGVDSVALEEECAVANGAVSLPTSLKPGANTRKAGEDVAAGAVALSTGRRIGPPDLALMSALGIAEVETRRPLRVAVLSTGDELIADPGADAAPHQIFDANRPMLAALLRRWGYETVDLGHVADDPARIRAALDAGAEQADAILTSGGASAGDEDHVSRLLRDEGRLSSWRVAMKPGRPLALAQWGGAMVFGLPGNPVAAFICALIFARPALSLMAGAGWAAPQGFTVPAAFAKAKKADRREYLRARLDAQGRAEAFSSEGSGRISGLSWAEGLVELPDAAARIAPGDNVRFIPFSALGV